MLRDACLLILIGNLIARISQRLLQAVRSVCLIGFAFDSRIKLVARRIVCDYPEYIRVYCCIGV